MTECVTGDLHWWPMQEEAVNCPVPVPAGSETGVTPHRLPKLQPVGESVVHLLRHAKEKVAATSGRRCGEVPSETCRVDTLEDALGDTRERFQGYMRDSWGTRGRTQKFQEKRN